MDEGYRIVIDDDPAPETVGVIGRGIGEYNEEQAGDHRYQRLCTFLYGKDEEIVGGLVGAIYWDWFHIDLLWVKEELRGRGFGHRLLTAAEEEARRRGANHADMDTFSFQAPEFYEQHGYEVFGELREYPPGHKRLYMQKEL